MFQILGFEAPSKGIPKKSVIGSTIYAEDTWGSRRVVDTAALQCRSVKSLGIRQMRSHGSCFASMLLPSGYRSRLRQRRLIAPVVASGTLGVRPMATTFASTNNFVVKLA